MLIVLKQSDLEIFFHNKIFKKSLNNEQKGQRLYRV